MDLSSIINLNGGKDAIQFLANELEKVRALAQGNDVERISQLETRVAELETRIKMVQDRQDKPVSAPTPVV